MGDGHDGANSLDAVAPRRNGAGKDAGVLCSGADGFGHCARSRSFNFQRAVSRKHSCAGRVDLPVSVRGTVLGDLHFSFEPDAGGGLSDGAAQFVLTRISAFGICVCDRHDAKGHSGNQRNCAGAVLRDDREGGVPQGRRLWPVVEPVRISAGFRDHHFLAIGPKDESEGGVMVWERVWVILQKEFIQTLRNPRMRFLLFLPPVLQLIIFGYAVTLDVDHARIAWMDMDNTPESRALLARFEGSGHFDIVATPRSGQDVQNVLDHGEAHAVVRVLPEFARDLIRGRHPAVQVLVDGTNSNTASLVSSYAASVIADFSADDAPRRAGIGATAVVAGSAPNAGSGLVTPRARVWFNPDLRSRNYFVPGVAANILMMITLMLTGQAIIREKEIGTMEQLMVTPMR